MKKTGVLTGMSGYIHKIGFKLKKHSPEIYLAIGIVGVVAGAVLACKATLKVNDILEKAKEDINTIKESASNETLREKYSPQDAQRDLTIVYAQTGVKLVKLYAPAVIIGTLSVVGILASHGVMRQRGAALTAAYAAAEKGFREYKNRVIERFGKDADHELKYDIKAKMIDEIVTDENGQERTIQKTINIAGIEYSEYARFFDETCLRWEKSAEFNLAILHAEQNYANEKLKAHGYLFLNDVYDRLGIAKTKAGQIVGWVYNPDNPSGDNYVDFGIYDVHKECSRAFVNGYERSILLDFNVDGNILDLI